MRDYLEAGKTVLCDWFLEADGYFEGGEPVYLSFDVGHAQLLGDLQVWHYNGSNGGWSQLDPIDLTYDRTYASFTTSVSSVIYTMNMP